MNKHTHLLTPLQVEIIEHIRDYIEKKRFPPSMRDISASFGGSHENAYQIVGRIRKKGFLKQEPGKPRTLQIGKPYLFITEAKESQFGIQEGDYLTFARIKPEIGDIVLCSASIERYDGSQEHVDGRLKGITRRI